MYEVVPGLLLSTLPWWIAAPVLYLTVLVVGMALDETYVNRTTVLTGAIAVQIHKLVAGDVGLLVALYGDLGLVVGLFGLYAYVADAYVDNWFRVLAFFVYSPLSAFLVILTAGLTVFGVEILFVPALVVAAYANLQLLATLRPTKPYYFGPESPEEFEAVVEETDSADAQEPHATAAAGDAESDGFEESDPASNERADVGRPSSEPAAAGDSTERGILPEFMRRL